VLGAAGDVVPEPEAGDEAGGEDAGGDDAGGEEAGGEDAGGDDAGGEEAGGDDAGGEEAGGEDAGGDDAGGEDFADWLGLEDLDGCAEDCDWDWDTIGVGGRDVLEVLDRVGLRNMFGETRAAADGADDEPVPGLDAGSYDAKAGEVATAPAPACGWR
jgi:hypothetical protein